MKKKNTKYSDGFEFADGFTIQSDTGSITAAVDPNASTNATLAPTQNDDGSDDAFINSLLSGNTVSGSNLGPEYPGGSQPNQGSGNNIQQPNSQKQGIQQLKNPTTGQNTAPKPITKPDTKTKIGMAWIIAGVLGVGAIACFFIFRKKIFLPK